MQNITSNANGDSILFFSGTYILNIGTPLAIIAISADYSNNRLAEVFAFTLQNEEIQDVSKVRNFVENIDKALISNEDLFDSMKRVLEAEFSIAAAQKNPNAPFSTDVKLSAISSGVFSLLFLKYLNKTNIMDLANKTNFNDLREFFLKIAHERADSPKITEEQIS